MNLIAIDIGNTNISTALFLDDSQQFVETIPGQSRSELAACLESAWARVPLSKLSKAGRRNGSIVLSSVKDAWTRDVEKIAGDVLGEKIQVIGRDVPLPISLLVDEPGKVGADRVLCAAAAYAVVNDAVIVADFGTAVTIDLVDSKGNFLGGVIFPGFDISTSALSEKTARLPRVSVSRPARPYGTNTVEAINCGLYYSTVGAAQEIVRRFAEVVGKWPHTIATGAGAELIKDDCDFIDSFVPGLVLKGILLAYRKYIDEKC